MDEGGTVREGVYVARRDTNSRLNAWAGGRVFPGVHCHANFTVRESADRFDVGLRSDDHVTSLSVSGRRANRWPASSVFGSVDEASAFFEAGSVAYSATREPTRYQGLELRCLNWRVEPLEVAEVHSSFFEDATIFPQGSIEFDCALLMRGVEHEWHVEPDMLVPRLRFGDRSQGEAVFVVSRPPCPPCKGGECARSTIAPKMNPEGATLVTA